MTKKFLLKVTFGVCCICAINYMGYQAMGNSMIDKKIGVQGTAKIPKKDRPMRGEGGGLGNSKLDTSAIKNKFLNTVYGTESKTQTLDIYLPNSGKGNYPVIVAIHGGGFMMGSSQGGDLKSMLEGVNRGYAVVCVNYRLSSEAKFPAAVNDCKSAIRFIKENAKKYNLNANKIAVFGDSAGGNLAAMIGTTGDIDEIGSNKTYKTSSKVQAVVDWFGPLNFLKMDEQFAKSGIQPKFGKTSSETSPESQYIGQLITKNKKLTAKSNPETYVKKLKSSTAPVFLIEHGTKDRNVPTQQSIDFYNKLKKQIGAKKVRLKLLEGAGHGTSEFDAKENLDYVYAFLDKYLK